MTPVIQNLLHQAVIEERIVFGVFSCAKLLESDPCGVSACFLTELTPNVDVTLHIQHKLIEAYCREHEILVIKVKKETLTSLCSSFNTVYYNRMNNINDLDCLLIQYQANASKGDDTILEYVPMK